MLFNSLAFAAFLPIVFFLYWFAAKQHRSRQNLLLLLASYFFYACWDWRFLFLLLFSTALDYYTGVKIHESEGKRRKYWLWLSVSINLGFLAVFKYYNFFAASAMDFLGGFGLQVHLSTLQIILPVGISFYTFHGLSYVIDIYRRRIEPERHVVTYSLFVSYFPLLVAGPIERATHLLPQLKADRTFRYAQARDGLYQIFWGLLKKVVIADTCAMYVNDIFDTYPDRSATTLALGAVYFAFQIYGDFSGYSDIALGTSKLFGIDLLRNFNYPYFSRDIAEFWRRWHISLSSWFRDYLYVPLGGSRGGLWVKIRNTFIIFLVSGFWHGANWTFIVWGAINAVYFLPLLIANRNRDHLGTVAEGRTWPSWRELAAMLTTFALTCVAWIFFRAPSVRDAVAYFYGIFTQGSGTFLEYLPINRYNVELLPMLALFVAVEWSSRMAEHPVRGKHATGRAVLVLLCIALFGAFSSAKEFIYFQF